MDEFPVRHEADAAPESGRRGLTTIVSIAAASVIALGAIYFFYAGSRPQLEPAATGASVPLASDTDVAVEPAATRAPPSQPVPSAPPEAPAAARGELVVRSTPSGALVTVDGMRAGLTPVTVSDLDYGTHDVQVARPGFAPVTERVSLTDAEPSRSLTVALGAGSAGVAAPDGLLEVDSRPRGAAVLVNGRRVGTTPLRLPGLGPGLHAVHIELAGYRTVRAEVPVERGQPARLAVTLEAVRR